VSQPLQDHVSIFANAGSPSEQLEALRALAQTKTLPSAAKTEFFLTGLERLVNALSGATAEQRLYALAALGRIRSSVKQLRQRIEQVLSTSDVGEPIRLTDLADPDDRAYVAEACGFVRAPWLPRYVAYAAANEDAGETARTESIRALLLATGDLRESIKLVADRLAALTFETERPADSMGRRARRVLASFHIALMSQPTISVDGSGRELGTLLFNSFSRVGQPTLDPLKREIAAATSQLVHDIVRVRFSHATDPGTYEALEVLRRWFRPHEWEELATGTPTLIAIADDVQEAITLLAKAGVTDNRMKVSLVLAVGSESRSNAALKRLAEELSGVDPDIRDWLTGSESVRVLEAVEESAARTLDKAIADVLVRREQIERAKASLATGEQATLLRVLADAFFEMARARALELAYIPGEAVEYSPSDHELFGGPRQGVRRVLIVEPQVRARQSNGSFRVVRKALVKPEVPE
jgi:hypothetical protein